MPGTRRRCPPRAAHQRAQAPTPSRRPRTRGQVLKVAVGPNGVPLRPELLPALHQPPPASRPVPTPRSRPPAYRSPCPAGRERGDLPEPPEPVRTPALPPGGLRHSGQVEGRIRERDRGGLRLSFPARPPQRPPPPPAAGLEENTAPGRPPRRAGAGLLSSEV